MRKIKNKDRSLLINAALGKAECDLTITNGNLLNVFTGEIYPVEIDILDGFIVRVREESQKQIGTSKTYFNAEGAYLIPGFIDTHMHVESTMMIPENLSRAIVPWGTTTICTDPHEIGNVMGIDGVKFMLESSKKSALRQYVLAPSSVPSVPGKESTGACFLAKEVGEMLDMDEVIGIAEIMDYVGVINDSERMHTIIDEGIKRNVFLQGHSPRVNGEQLSAYLLGGPRSDHESTTAEEAREKLRNGMFVDLRQSSLSKSIEFLVEGIKDMPWKDHVSICTDDVHSKDILTIGHINNVVKMAVECGIDEKEAIKMATLNAAREYGFNDLGAIAPGYIADIQVVSDLKGSKPNYVFIEGQLVADHGKYLGSDINDAAYDLPNTVNIPQITSADCFGLKVPEGYDKDTIVVNVMTPVEGNKKFHYLVATELPVVNGQVDISNDPDLIYVSCINRYGSGDVTTAIYRDFGLKEGALGSTISHDSHNLTICYFNNEDGYKVAKALQECGGGICILKDKETTTLQLPVAGLMSQKSCEDIAEEIDRVQAVLDTISSRPITLMVCAIIALPVKPAIVITDKGLVDGTNQEFVDIFKL